MSANIYWRHHQPEKDQCLNIGAPSSFQEMMSSAGMQLPCTLDESHLDKLRAMAAVFGRHPQTPNPFDEIVDLLETYNAIELWAVY